MLRSTLGLGVVFLAVALIAGLFGFGVLTGESRVAAKVFFVFLILSLVAFVWGGSARSGAVRTGGE